jgi:hypothetical protein
MRQEQAPQKARVSQRDAAALYDKLAGLYDIWGHLTASRARNRALELANVKPGEHVLEVVVGTGLAFVGVVRENPNGRNADSKDIKVLARIIRESFHDIAALFSLTLENCPKHPLNCTTSRIELDMARGVQYFILSIGGKPIGCVGLESPSIVYYLERLKDRHILFPGDVYLVAVWVAMSNRAKSTPTCKKQTTLNGLASKFSSLYGIDYSNPLDPDDVMAIFRRHGIKGNPCLRFDDQGEPPQPFH